MKKQIIVSCLILFVSFSFFFVNYFNPINLEPIRSTIFALVDFARTKSVQKENEVLKEKISVLETNKAKSELLEKENKDLKKLLNIKISKNTKKTYAKVIGTDFSQGYSITVNKGTNDGIIIGDIAVFGESLVGRVEEVFDKISKIKPISSPDISVGSMIPRSQALGYTEGSRENFSHNKVALYLFGGTDFAAVGDRILTSGLGTAYPEGFLIGTVTDSTDRKTHRAEVTLSVDLFSLRHVTILTEVK